MLEWVKCLPSHILNHSAVLSVGEFVFQLLFDPFGELVEGLLQASSLLVDMRFGSNLLVTIQTIEVGMRLEHVLKMLYESYWENVVVGFVVGVMTVLHGVEFGHVGERGSVDMTEAANFDCFDLVLGLVYVFQSGIA